MKTTIQKIKTTFSQNSIYYIAGSLFIYSLKLFYSRADSESLGWILRPTALWVRILTGIPFYRQPGAGYVNHSLRFVIAPSCCGIRFMTIVIAMLIFTFVHRAKRKALWTLLSVCFSFPYTVFVNGLRITLAIYIPLCLPALTVPGSPLTPDRLHTLTGAVVYFAALLPARRLAAYLTHDKAAGPGMETSASFLSPAFWYFFIVLGLPFVNRAYQRSPEQFTEYALLITCGCAAVLLIPVAGHLLKIRRRSAPKT